MPYKKEHGLQKKPEEFALEYAGFWIRLGASIIDTVIFALFLFIIYRIILQFTLIKVPGMLSYFEIGCIVWAEALREDYRKLAGAVGPRHLALSAV